MKLEFQSIEELIEFYKKYIEPTLEEKQRKSSQQKQEFEPYNDLILQTQKNNKMNMADLAKILK